MHKEHMKGFTLIELLSVVALMTLAVMYFTQFYIDKYERNTWDSSVSDLLTLNRVITMYAINNGGKWPGQAELDEECGDPLPDLSNYINTTDWNFSDYSYDCSEDYYATVTLSGLLNAKEAEYIASMLPVAKVNDGDQNSVEMWIHKPRRQTTVTTFQALPASGHNGSAFFSYPENCRTPQISVTPDKVCTDAGDEAIGGFKVRVSPDNRRKVWEVWLQARSESGTYENISACAPGPGEEDEPITFNAIIFCQAL